MRTLLLADDNVTVQRVIALTFAQEPVRVVTASDGHQAMDRVIMDRPDIVLAGTTLPQVNGYELARFVKSKPESRNVPVLLLSGAFETIDEAQLKSSGANGVIEKPVEPTTVIRRVKELLGLTSEGETTALAAGRLVTPAGATPDNRPAPPLPTVPRMVTSTHPMRSDLRREPPAQAPPKVDTADKGDDYLESLESAFDTLDQQLAGRLPTAPDTQRNPPPPLGRVESGDPRSPGKRPSTGTSEPGNPVYEVDQDWFAEAPQREDARAARRDIAEDLSAPELQAPAPGPASPVYEVDDEWFAEDQKARHAREVEQKQLAAEMGIHEVTLPEPVQPEATTVPTGLARKVREVHEVHEVNVHEVYELDAQEVHEVRVQEVLEVYEVQQVDAAPKTAAPPVQQAQEVRQEPASYVEPVQHIDQIQQRAQEQPPPAPTETIDEIEISAEADDAIAIEPVPRGLPIDWFAMASAKPVRQPDPPAPESVLVEVRDPALVELPKVAPLANVAEGAPPKTPGRVADDFAALLAFEQGEKTTPPMIEPIIHAVTPEITPEMLEQIATTVADRLRGTIHVEPLAPELTGEMLETIAVLVSGNLKDTIRVEPAAPEISGEMLKTIAFLVSGHLRDQITVEPAAPVITDAIVEQISATVADRLKDTVRVEPAAPVITDAIVEQLSGLVAERLADRVRVEPKAPEISDDMLERVAFSVADRLKDSVRIAPVAPEITDDMLQRVSESVAARLKDSIRVEPAIPELNGAMLDQIAGTVAERLTDAVRQSVRVETVAPEVSGDMLEHIAHRVSERLQSSLPQAPPPPQISDEMLDRVAARVTDRMQGTFSIDGLRASITAAIRDTVRAVVSDTSERLVREEIERIKNKAP
jgi:CheY-like chemotaxis protein